ncbi:MAG: hypothetical protein GF329_08430 [Candidatus Lokiarchaeota archaeon]|nr:hypothetical protein [Candidatus Lokiarchaeota archaeon]
MPRRVVKIGRKTHAKDETFELERKDRYMLNISLMSLKARRDHDIGRGGEFFFKVHREGEMRGRRTPDHGEIRLMENQIFTARQDFTLWTEFITRKRGTTKDINVNIKIEEHDPIKNDKVVDEDIVITLGRSKAQYITLTGKDDNLKAKIKISARRTRY